MSATYSLAEIRNGTGFPAGVRFLQLPDGADNANVAEIRAAIRLAGDASFECGEWDPDDSDESYSDVLARSLAADSYLFALLGIPEDAQGATTVHSPADLVRQARVHLRLAREALKAAGAPRAAERVRAALRSADGAQRHADLAPYREERREKRNHY